MNCPRCETAVLREGERDGVVVDVCPACRGVWLDRGELEKIISRASAEIDAFERRPPAQHRRDPRDSDSGEYRKYGGAPGQYPPRKRRWYETLGDLID